MRIVARSSRGHWWDVPPNTIISFYRVDDRTFTDLVGSDGKILADCEPFAIVEANPADQQAPDPITDAPLGYVWFSRFGGHAHLVLAKEAIGGALCGCPDPGMLRSFKLPENSAGACPSCLVRLDRKEAKL